ncbi:MAG: hypothetical protein M8353_12205, partial [ANME-2 cluster archaeon]|nr:hypothetical protein [ANME-2 cluster archaeon]
YNNEFWKSGHCNIQILYTGYTGSNRVWIHDNTFNEIYANAGVRLDDVSGSLIENNVFTSDGTQGDHAIYISYKNDADTNCQDNEVRFNRIYNVREYGILFCARVDGGAVVLSETTGNHIHHNLIYNSVGDGNAGGVCIYGIDGAVIEYNTIADGDGDGISTRQYYGSTSSGGFTVYAENNIISGMNTYSTRGYGINNYENAKHTIISKYNCLYDNQLGNYNNVDSGTGDAANGKYYLNSTGLTWNGTGWESMSTLSPCIDAADPADSYENEPYVNGGRANMGRWGNTQYASNSGWGFDTSHIYVGTKFTAYTDSAHEWNYGTPPENAQDITDVFDVVLT